MKQNMGNLDKAIRVLVAVVIAVLVFAGVFILTSLLGSCPLYLPFGISTKKD